jgi:hypothetical protein
MWQLQAMQEEEGEAENPEMMEEADDEDADERSVASDHLEEINDGEEVPDEQAVEAFTVSIASPDINCAHDLFTIKMRIIGTTQ